MVWPSQGRSPLRTPSGATPQASATSWQARSAADRLAGVVPHATSMATPPGLAWPKATRSAQDGALALAAAAAPSRLTSGSYSR